MVLSVLRLENSTSQRSCKWPLGGEAADVAVIRALRGFTDILTGRLATGRLEEIIVLSDNGPSILRLENSTSQRSCKWPLGGEGADVAGIRMSIES